MPTDAAHYHIYGNAGTGGPIDYGTILATVSGTTWTTPALAAGSSWAWAVRAFDPATGLEESNVDQRAFVVLSGTGGDLTNLPAPPVGLSVTAAAGGALEVAWHAPVSPRDPARPTRFFVYVGTGGTPSYAAAVRTVPAYPGRSSYRCQLAGLTGGIAYSVGVRAGNAAGVETNTTARTVTADATPPPNVAALAAALVL